MENTVQFVTEHVKIVQLHIADLVSFLMGHGLKHVDEGERAGQECLVQTVLEATSKGRHEFTVGHKVVLRDIELLHVDCGVLLVLNRLFSW